MKDIVLLINQQNIGRVKALLEENNIPYREAGYPNGSVEVRERFPSKINLHADMEKYAKSKGYKDITDAIGKMGSARVFRQSFDREFNPNLDG